MVIYTGRAATWRSVVLRSLRTTARARLEAATRDGPRRPRLLGLESAAQQARAGGDDATVVPGATREDAHVVHACLSDAARVPSQLTPDIQNSFTQAKPAEHPCGRALLAPCAQALGHMTIGPGAFSDRAPGLVTDGTSQCEECLLLLSDRRRAR